MHLILRTELPGANEDQRRQLECRLDDGMPPIAVDRAQKLRDLARVGNRRPIGHLDARQGAAQIPRGIALGPAGGDCVANDPADALLGPVRSLVLAAPLEPAKHAEQLRRRQCGNWTRSDIREQKILERPHRLLERFRREWLLREPLARDRFARAGAAGALGAPLGGRIAAGLAGYDPSPSMDSLPRTL